MGRQLDEETTSRLQRRMNVALGHLPPVNVRCLIKGGDTYFRCTDLTEWFQKLAETAISDQKQEVYLGLREYLTLLSQSESTT